MIDQLTWRDYMAMAVLIVCVVGILVTEHKRRNAFISCSEWRRRMRKEGIGTK